MKMYSENLGILHLDYRGRPPDAGGLHKKEWTAYTGLYNMNIYGTEPVFCGVKIKDDGYLYLKWEASERLYPHENIQNLFFTFSGDAVIFEEDHLWYDNIKWRKINNPVTAVTALFKSSKHRTQEWIIDGAAATLQYLEREEEAEMILQLKQK
jgi:hypothetical protein